MAKKPAVSHASQRSVSSTPKAATPVPAPASAPKPAPNPVASSAPPRRPQSTLSPRSSPQEIALHVWNKHLNETPPRTLLLDAFMAFLVLVGAVQFLYCLLAGNYPFNAFLSGFSAAVGQFVLCASLRMQTSERPPVTASQQARKTATKTMDGVTGEFVEEGASKYSSERAFADFVFGSLILHGFCVNFIN